MIRLELQPYCDSCLEFEPDVQKPDSFYAGGEVYFTSGDTVIRCEHRDKCERIRKFLKGE